jgi:DNA gyrase/topoisomerase IV subunit A
MTSLLVQQLPQGDNEILLASSSGKLIRFNESHVRPMGRTARGVRGIRLKKDEKLISLMIADQKKLYCVFLKMDMVKKLLWMIFLHTIEVGKELFQ